ncbi:MAG: hypothetical protein IT450_03505 [Phycisphaerales bacterium]|nr:hypothetical protein [Phycisphaerales bacterium]
MNSDFAIRVSGDVCTLVEKGRSLILAWDTVTGIAAYKRDLFSVDLVCLALFRDGDEPVEFAEDMPGWDEFTDALERRFGVRSGWYSQVCLPPFALSWLTLWGDAPPPDNRCWKCGYDLTGNVSGTCPECGTKFVQ